MTWNAIDIDMQLYGKSEHAVGYFVLYTVFALIFTKGVVSAIDGVKWISHSISARRERKAPISRVASHEHRFDRLEN